MRNATFLFCLEQIFIAPGCTSEWTLPGCRTPRVESLWNRRFLLIIGGAACLCFRRTRPCLQVKDQSLNVSVDFAVNAADRVFKRMQPPRDHREKQQHGMLKQNGNERFYQFFFPLLCARSPQHQLGEKWTPPALSSLSHLYCFW